MPHVILGPCSQAAAAAIRQIRRPCSFPFRSTLELRSRTIEGATIKCMANPRRVKMVAKQIRREISNMLLTDTVLQHAILPEASLGADRYLSSLTTVSDVEVSGDLQVVKVYVSVFGDERGKEIAIAGLKSKARYVRSQIGKRMRLRLTPEIRFIEDESLERGSRVSRWPDMTVEFGRKSDAINGLVDLKGVIIIMLPAQAVMSKLSSTSLEFAPETMFKKLSAHLFSFNLPVFFAMLVWICTSFSS